MRPDSFTPDTLSGASGEDPDRIAFTVPGTNEGARSAIERITVLIDETTVREEDINALEIALAEVFNNIVEHAYLRHVDGVIDVTVEMRDPGLHITIWDDGDPMPAGRLPGGQTADPRLHPHEQAEGGYGLFLIRQLSKKLRYHRVGDRNQLSFRVPLTPR